MTHLKQQKISLITERYTKLQIFWLDRIFNLIYFVRKFSLSLFPEEEKNYAKHIINKEGGHVIFNQFPHI